MISKKGSLVLRDVVFMMLIVSAIFVFAGLFVNEMAINYENTNMTDEFGDDKTNSFAQSMLNDTHNDLNTEADDMDTGILDLIKELLTSIGGIVKMVLTAPNTIGGLLTSTLEDMLVPDTISIWTGRFVAGILWAIILFTIYSSFLKGGKL